MPKPVSKKPVWTLEEARELIAAIQGHLWDVQYHVALGGGVLNQGQSMKDLDLYFLPFNRGGNREAVVRVLYAAGFTPLEPLGADRRSGDGAEDYELSEDDPWYITGKTLIHGKRIDVFIA